MELWISTVVFGWLMLAVLSTWIAGQKNRGEDEGFILGALFGPLGVLVEALLPAHTPPPPPRPPTKAELEAERRSARLERWLLAACFMLIVGGTVAVVVLERLGMSPF
jgi:hypothetical protein